ncbi:MAG: (E)-4-hydroxy-3-methylbut-2-enyl-diphosphate synthase [Ignavibacteria bacterium]|nr:(E)-4-hydroxy-3-methylbut-2-enyl-diphosphate synthase [Ignavibacteria bacterium]
MRFKTRIVNIGNVPLGGSNPIRLQSMTTTDTMNTQATAEQCIRIINAGADYVRITVPASDDAENLLNIKKELRKKGYKTPLIADIHFNPNVAGIAARIVEKIRINPGNYADRKKFIKIDYSDEDYEKELERIKNKFVPLVRVCKEYGTVMRIGANHGSLSDRIMNRYGDTPEGMVESVLEFVRICENEGYKDIIVSVKASNPVTMIAANRLLVKKMIDENMNYPVHLGVTEAGEGEDGRIKSAVGIGTLLKEGIGDTIRVSLTEEPEFEIPVCKILAEKFSEYEIADTSNYKIKEDITDNYKSTNISNIGSDNVPVVFLSIDKFSHKDERSLKNSGYLYNEKYNTWEAKDNAFDYLYSGSEAVAIKIPDALKEVMDYDYWMNSGQRSNSYPLIYGDKLKDVKIFSDDINFFITDEIKQLDELKTVKENIVLIINIDKNFELIRHYLINNNFNNPAVLYKNYGSIKSEELIIRSAVDFGSILMDNFGDGIWLDAEKISDGKTETINKAVFLNNISFGILQAVRKRITKTEYISCPSCGRTMFDIQEITAEIMKQTKHLKGLKIAVMGCIINGPGEMADADYGYVGSGINKVTLYKGRNIIKKNIDSVVAVDELIKLIKDNGDWKNLQEANQ